MLKLFTLEVIIIYQLYVANLCACMRKNVCRTFEDYRTIQQNPNCWYNPDVGASPNEIAKRYGFPFEKHEITTKDGYIVTVFRIPHNGTDINRKRPVVFLQHGFATDGSSWMTTGSESSVFFFANHGYDVWISNSRGSKYSPKHVKYTVYDPVYWNFSFHELAIYDLPAMLDYIGQKTGQTGYITYIGHSMGTTMSFVYASLMPEHAQTTLKTIVALAPVAFMDHVTSIAKTLVPFRYLIWDFLVSIGLYGFGPNVQFKIDLLHKMCSSYPFIMICAQLQDLSGGYPLDDKASEFPLTFGSFPSGFSFKTMLHYGQIMAEKQRFQFFDYGPRLNQFFYNTSTPPEYPLTRIKIPTHLFYSKSDLLSREKDVLNLYDKLNTEKTVMEVSNPGHFTFLTNIDLDKILLNYL